MKNKFWWFMKPGDGFVPIFSDGVFEKYNFPEIFHEAGCGCVIDEDAWLAAREQLWAIKNLPGYV